MSFLSDAHQPHGHPQGQPTQYPANPANLPISAVPADRQHLNSSTGDVSEIPQSAHPENRVLIIATGGTICMKESPEGLVPARGFLEGAMRPRPSFNDGMKCDELPVKLPSGETIQLASLRTPPSKYSRKIRYTLHEFPELLDSSSINAKGWSQIAACVEANYSFYDGFVILHGTDSLAYSASALSFMFSSLGKPVILTGSQSPIFALQSDAVDNLLGSLIIAGTFTIPEVCLFFHHNLYRGNRTTKISASSFDAFASPNMQPLATVTGMGIDVYFNLVRRPTSIKRFSVQHTLDTGHVACLRIFPGITAQLIDAVLRLPGLRGLILETFGAGNAPTDEELMSVIRAAISREIVIVNVSQCPSGTVSPLYAPAHVLGNAGVVFGHDLTTEAALTKLFYLLVRKDLTYSQIVDEMSRNLRGEMTELPSSIQFAHTSTTEPGSSLSDKQMAFTELSFAISNSDYELVRSILDSDSTPEGLLYEQDAMGNTPLHMASVGEDSDEGVAIMGELLGRGCSVHVRNLAHNTPLWIAEKLKNERKIELLKEAGALLNVEEDRRLNMRDAAAGMSRIPSAWQSRRTSFNDERPVLSRANTLSHFRNISGMSTPASSNDDRALPAANNKPFSMVDTATGTSTPLSAAGEQRLPAAGNKPFTMADTVKGASTTSTSVVGEQRLPVASNGPFTMVDTDISRATVLETTSSPAVEGGMKMPQLDE